MLKVNGTYHLISLSFFFLGECKLPEHHSCFPDVCTQTWTTSCLPYGKDIILFISRFQLFT